MDTLSSSTALHTLMTYTQQVMDRKETDSSGNPILTISHHINQKLHSSELNLEDIDAIIRTLRDEAFYERAERLRHYVGGVEKDLTSERMTKSLDNFIHMLSEEAKESDKSSSPNFATFKKEIERRRFAMVFTAHPTFALANTVYAELAQLASHPSKTSNPDKESFATHRRSTAPTLEEEFRLATEAILRGRNSLDLLNEHIFTLAAKKWPEQALDLTPSPVILTSWVGYDTDGRIDIGWWDTLRLRLRMKYMQIHRFYDQISSLQNNVIAPLVTRLEQALSTIQQQIDSCPTSADTKEVAAFSEILIKRRAEALLSDESLADIFTNIQTNLTEENEKTAFAIARTGFITHGMSIAHTHVRLNSRQLHNVARQRLNIVDSPENPVHRRSILTQINAALDKTITENSDFGALLLEQASAARLMITVSQIVKYIDTKSPIRFLIAETESGYTLLVALWLARLFGVENNIEISPLFETHDALVHGAQIIEEALRSPHYRDYLRKTGKLCLQFGYSDSGRYVGQLASTYLIERLRLQLITLLKRHKLTDIELILFDTHGESIGRGAHPFQLSQRLDYLSPPYARAAFKRTGIFFREESACQGGDGYLLFGTQTLSNATISVIVDYLFTPLPQGEDPIYGDPDFSAEFFNTIETGMSGLVADKGYAALLGSFGPSLIDKTGSRPSARQNDSSASTIRIRHPSELRAIPNNAILQQLGWCANTIQGIGAAALRNPETFKDFMNESPRFQTAMEFVAHALTHSDAEVLRATILLFDPGYWLERAAGEKNSESKATAMALASKLQKLNLWSITQAMFHRIQADHLALRTAWPQAPSMSPKEQLLHALRLALVERIWTLATNIPYFSPQFSINRDALDVEIFYLEIPAALKVLLRIFPQGTDDNVMSHFFESTAKHQTTAYVRENQEIFQPLKKMFDQIREISVAIMHSVGSFG